MYNSLTQVIVDLRSLSREASTPSRLWEELWLSSSKKEFLNSIIKRRKDRYTLLDLFPGLILIVKKMFYIDCLLVHYRAKKDQLISDIVQQYLAIWLASTQQPVMDCPPIIRGFNRSDIARRRLPTHSITFAFIQNT